MIYDVKNVPVGLVVKNPPDKTEATGDVDAIPGLEGPLEQEMAATAVFLLEKFHGQRNLMGYSPWGRKELDRTDCTHARVYGVKSIMFSSVQSLSHVGLFATPWTAALLKKDNTP